MATDHRGNPINNNNPAKTNKDRMRQSDDDNNPTFEDELKYMDETGIDPMTGRNLYGEPDEYPEESPEEEEIAERKSQSYMREMEEYYRPVSDRTYGKDEMIENDIDDDKY